MKKMYVVAALALGVSQLAVASSKTSKDANSDSIKVDEMQEVVVNAVKAKKDMPFAVTNIKRDELEAFSKTGRELPFLFARTPGVLAWSENGLGTGTTYMRLRGAGDSRINITLDGVPLNSPEDQCVFWANMNSYASILGGAQIQRGVGTSTNGDGAFGGSVALQTKAPSFDPMLEITGSYGSYNTYNVGGNFSTGLSGIMLKKGFLILDGAYHHTGTKGYINGTAGNSGSYYAGLTYINDKGNLKLSYKNIGNYEKTGQAWTGVQAGDNSNSLIEGSNLKWVNDEIAGTYPTGITSYQDLYNAGLGRFNNLYEGLDYSKNGLNTFANADGSYSTTRYQMSDGSYWDRTTDNFWQNHNLLSAAWKIDEHWSTTATLHYTHGHGYYDEFKPDYKLKKFGLPYFYDSTGKKYKSLDMVRKKGLTQDTYGLVWSANYQNKWVDAVAGMSVQQFEGNHYGYVTYMSVAEAAKKYLSNGDYQYYDSDADKADMSTYLKGNFHVTKHFDIFGDLQYRYVHYYTTGNNDKFYEISKGVEYKQQMLNINETYNFFNPKAGLSYHIGGHQAYASFAFSHREPERNNFTDNGQNGIPSAERLLDYEAGYTYQGSIWHAGINLYYMDYVNQFVQDGRLSDIGEKLTSNIRDSYRMGIEISAGVDVTKWLSLEANATLSKNKIKDFDQHYEHYDEWFDKQEDDIIVHYNNSTLAFSPSAIVNGFADFHFKGLSATWHTNFVSKQYMDNTKTDLRSLPKYSTSNIYLSYDLKVAKKGLKHILFGMNFNNIFNKHYACNGWTYTAVIDKHTTAENPYTSIGYIPMAGFTCMGNITLKF